MSKKEGKELTLSLGAMIPGSKAGDRAVDMKKIKENTVAKIKAEKESEKVEEK